MSVFDLVASVATSLPLFIDDVDPVAPPAISGGMSALVGVAKWVGLIVAVIALIITGAGMAYNQRRGEGSEAVTRLINIAIGVLVIMGAVSIISFVVDA